MIVEGLGRKVTDVNATIVQTGKNVVNAGRFVADVTVDIAKGAANEIKEGVKSFFSNLF